MAHSPRQWYDRVSQVLAEQGPVDPGWAQRPSWPFEGALVVRALDPPADEEPARSGADGRGCFVCVGVAASDADYLVWTDDLWVLGLPAEGSPLPFALFLMPRRHADLAGLSRAEAARQGELLTALEQAATQVLAVPRIQVARWGDGTEHLHWWLFARPTGMLQLRGTFLSHWADVLPPRPQEELRADSLLVVDRLVELAGGERLGGGPG